MIRAGQLEPGPVAGGPPGLSNSNTVVTHPPGNKLRVLGTEIDNENGARHLRAGHKAARVFVEIWQSGIA